MSKKRANGEGSIRKQKDGRWEGRYTAGRDPQTGKPIYKNVLGKTQGEVKEKLKRAMEENKKVDVTKAGQYTVAQWCWLWHENYCKPAVKDTTAEYYRSYIEHHVIPNRGCRTKVSVPALSEGFTPCSVNVWSKRCGNGSSPTTPPTLADCRQRSGMSRKP